jgi:hypothetical protein
MRGATGSVIMDFLPLADPHGWKPSTLVVNGGPYVFGSWFRGSLYLFNDSANSSLSAFREPDDA